VEEVVLGPVGDELIHPQAAVLGVRPRRAPLRRGQAAKKGEGVRTQRAEGGQRGRGIGAAVA
jgi:hypothetical protein